MAWIGALIGVGGALIGDSMSQSGQEATNAQSTANMYQQEQWQEKMSDTAMQRRVTDLKAAGLNPLLATGTSGAQVGSVGTPNLQNPDASYGNLGQQVSSAVGLYQQGAAIDLQKAQAAKVQAETENVQTDTAQKAAVLPYSAETASQNLENMKSQSKVIWNTAANLEQDYALKGANLESLNRDNNFQRQFLDLKTQIQSLDVQRARLGMPKLENDASWQQAHPQLSGWLQSGGIDMGVNAASKIGNLIK